MSATEPKSYTPVGKPIWDTWFDPDTRTTVEGWKQWVRWNRDGTMIPLRVPSTADFSTTVDTLARYQGAQLDALQRG